MLFIGSLNKCGECLQGMGGIYTFLHEGGPRDIHSRAKESIPVGGGCGGESNEAFTTFQKYRYHSIGFGLK